MPVVLLVLLVVVVYVAWLLEGEIWEDVDMGETPAAVNFAMPLNVHGVLNVVDRVEPVVTLDEVLHVQ